MTYFKTTTDAMGTTLFPVGSIYITVTSTNPGTYLGGTWVAFGTGRTLVGIDAGQTEFDTVEETGGAKTHTLQTTEIPAHSHSISNFPVWSNSAPYAVTSEYTIGATTTENTNNTGGGGAHNNLQPYIVVYMWKRTV
jgi:microcystin-dependent protein